MIVFGDDFIFLNVEFRNHLTPIYIIIQVMTY